VEICANLLFADFNHINLRICDLRAGTPKKLGICESGMSPRIFRFAIYGLLKRDGSFLSLFIKKRKSTMVERRMWIAIKTYGH
jgi:hypothetical protein